MRDAIQPQAGLFDEPGESGCVQASYHAGLEATRRLDRDEQRALGQYMTPVPIARMMALRAVRFAAHRDTMRVLDPAAGSGVLAAAAVEALLDQPARPRRIELLLYEIDRRFAPILATLCRSLGERCMQRGVQFESKLACEDFLLSDLARQQVPAVDLAIANPPYFKLAKSDRRSQAHAYAVHGQPNIYGLFMAACASLVRAGGGWCFITPRSWTSGDYFAAVRRHLLGRLGLCALHAFDSRTAHFADDEVLQEALITWALAAPAPGWIELSTSAGVRDIGRRPPQRTTVSRLIGPAPDQQIRLATRASEIDGLRCRLTDLDCAVSTGPVVAFRARPWLRAEPGSTTVPLLWMQHVQRGRVAWPMGRKLEHIEHAHESAWMLVPGVPMVLLRRFSPKEDLRRITAAAWAGESHRWIGLENHLNYVRGVRRELSVPETAGLAAYLNSEPVDRWLREVCGHTQINATDLRRLPVPDRSRLAALGLALGPEPSLRDGDDAVARMLDEARRSSARSR